MSKTHAPQLQYKHVLEKQKENKNHTSFVPIQFFFPTEFVKTIRSFKQIKQKNKTKQKNPQERNQRGDRVMQQTSTTTTITTTTTTTTTIDALFRGVVALCAGVGLTIKLLL